MRGTVGGVSDADSGSRLVSERLVLASASPRRQQLFSLLNVPFVTATADVDEEIGEGESPQEMVRRLSLAKARAVALSYPEGLIVAADTTVVVDGDVLGKPADEAEAIAMLRRLRGRKHTVFSGVTVYRPPPLSLPSTGPPFHPPHWPPLSSPPLGGKEGGHHGAGRERGLDEGLHRRASSSLRSQWRSPGQGWGLRHPAPELQSRGADRGMLRQRYGPAPLSPGQGFGPTRSDAARGCAPGLPGLHWSSLSRGRGDSGEIAAATPTPALPL